MTTARRWNSFFPFLFFLLLFIILAREIPMGGIILRHRLSADDQKIFCNHQTTTHQTLPDPALIGLFSSLRTLFRVIPKQTTQQRPQY